MEHAVLWQRRRLVSGDVLLQNYVQITFMTGSSLDPVPPKVSKVEGTRYLDVHEDEALDRDQLASWVRQALKLPGLQL